MGQPDKECSNCKDYRHKGSRQKNYKKFGREEFGLAHSVDHILPDGLIGKFVRDQYDHDDGRKYQNIPDTGKESHILPHIGKIIYSNMGERDWQSPVHAIDHIIDHEFSEQYTGSKKNEIQAEQDPEYFIGPDLLEFYFE